jgi:hypothetical protein
MKPYHRREEVVNIVIIKINDNVSNAYLSGDASGAIEFGVIAIDKPDRNRNDVSKVLSGLGKQERGINSPAQGHAN